MIQFGSMSECKINHIHNGEEATLCAQFTDEGGLGIVIYSGQVETQRVSLTAVQVALLKQIFPFCSPIS